MVDVLPTREAGPLAEWLISHPGVEIICRDRAGAYAQGAGVAPPMLCRSLTGSICGRWLKGRSGQPESYCHRQMADAVRYLVAGGITWRAMPADFPAWDRVYAFFRRWRDKGLTATALLLCPRDRSFHPVGWLVRRSRWIPVKTTTLIRRTQGGRRAC